MFDVIYTEKVGVGSAAIKRRNTVSVSQDSLENLGIINYFEVIKKIEMLEDHSNIFSDLIDISALVHNILPVDNDRPAGSFLEAVEAS